MNKKELVAAVAARSGVSQTNAGLIIKKALEVVDEALKRDEPIVLSGFGTFYVKMRNPRKALNLHTREVIDVPSKKVVTFRPTKTKK